MSFLTQQLNILNHSLDFIAVHGWTKKSLVLGSKKAGLNPDLLSFIFPKEAESAYEVFVYMINQKFIKKASYLTTSSLRTNEKVEECIVLRLNLLEPYRACLIKAKAFHISPNHAIFSSKMLYTIADTIWFVCADKSMNWNHYTKRSLLCYVYLSTFFKWLETPEKSLAESLRPHIKLKIQSIMLFPKIKKKISDFFSKATPIFSWHKNIHKK